jgi:hypothetical protein
VPCGCKFRCGGLGDRPHAVAPGTHDHAFERGPVDVEQYVPVLGERDRRLHLEQVAGHELNTVDGDVRELAIAVGQHHEALVSARFLRWEEAVLKGAQVLDSDVTGQWVSLRCYA